MTGKKPSILYTDLDGTMLGMGGSLFRTETGAFTMAGAEALGVCRRHGLEFVLASGRSMSMLQEDARLLGATSFIGEAGCVIARDSGEIIKLNCAPYGNVEELSVFDEIADTGAPDLLLESYSGLLAYHLPWSRNHDYSHLLRGNINTVEADALLNKNGYSELKVVDNGIIEDRGYCMNVGELHAYHIIPRQAGKGSAIRLHLETLGLERDDAIACGDSSQDLEMAGEVGTLYLMSNALSNGLEAKAVTRDYENVIIVDAPMVEGFLQAVRQALERDA